MFYNLPRFTNLFKMQNKFLQLIENCMSDTLTPQYQVRSSVGQQPARLAATEQGQRQRRGGVHHAQRLLGGQYTSQHIDSYIVSWFRVKER